MPLECLWILNILVPLTVKSKAREKLGSTVNLRQKQDLVKITIEKFQKVKKSDPTFPTGSLNK